MPQPAVYGLPVVSSLVRSRFRAALLATPDILSCWPLDEGSGTTVADIVRGLNGVLTGTYTLQDGGPSSAVPYGIKFNGGLATISAQVQPSVSDYTWELFFKLTSSPGNNVAILNGRSPTNARTLNFFLDQLNSSGTAGAPLLGVDSDSIALGARTSGTYNDGKWHHVVLSWDGTSAVNFANTQVTIYVDGRDAGRVSADTAGSIAAPIAGGTVFKIGHASLSNVSLAYVTNYSRALTAAEALKHYVAAGSPGG